MHADELGEYLNNSPGAARLLAATSIAKHFRVYSSMTVRHFSCWPFAHASNTKS